MGPTNTTSRADQLPPPDRSAHLLLGLHDRSQSSRTRGEMCDVRCDRV